MKLVLEIKDERDLHLLLPLLERLEIVVTNFQNGIAGIKKVNGKKKIQPNFDLEKLERCFDKLQEMKAFADVKDPVEWQKQIRDEWN